MSTLGEQRLPRHTRQGTGVPLQDLSEPITEHWGPFSGINLSVPPAALEAHATGDSLDMEVDQSSMLARAPGIVLLENLQYTPTALVAHPKLDRTTDLIIFAPPYVGVKNLAGTIWTNLGLQAKKVVATVYADVLVFSDQSKTWERTRDGTIREINVPPAHTLTVFGGRLVRGFTLADGNMEALFVGWSGASGDHTDLGLGSGLEPLLSEQVVGDYIVAHRVINLDFLATLNRRSIWIARLTGNGLVPFRWELRLRGVGAVAEQTCWSTDQGVIFLSDDGVRLFDGNSAPIISGDINAALLPLVNDGKDYSAYFDAGSKRYALFTPTETWVLDLPRRRWFKWSTVLKLGVGFPTQQAQETWASAVGTWGTDEGTWADLVSPELADRALLVQGTQLGTLTAGATTAFGVSLLPRWDLPPRYAEQPSAQFQHDPLELVRIGAGTMDYLLPNMEGVYADVFTRVLGVHNPDIANFVHTGRGMGVRLRIAAGSPRIERVSLTSRLAGRRAV